MSVVRASTIGVILGCILYAAYLLIFREIDANTFEKLQEVPHHQTYFSLESYVGTLK